MKALVVHAVDKVSVMEVEPGYPHTMKSPIMKPPTMPSYDQDFDENEVLQTYTSLRSHVLGIEGSTDEIIAYWPTSWLDSWGLAEVQKWLSQNGR